MTVGGDRLVASTEDSWECARSLVIKSGIYCGEDYDARLEIPECSTPSSCHGKWEAAVIFKPKDDAVGPIHDRFSPQIIKQRALSPKIIQTPAGETLLDFKQNIAGWLEVKNRAH